MNLLVTNTRNAQAYAIIQALRPYAQKIVRELESRKNTEGKHRKRISFYRDRPLDS